MTWDINTSCGNETSKIRHLAWYYVHGIGVDVGCGQDKVHPNTIPVDPAMHGSFPVAGMRMEAKDIRVFGDGALDYVYSSHYLEHCVDYKATLALWWSKVKVGGHLILYLPHKGMYPNIGQFGANPDHKHDFFPQDIMSAMHEVALADKSGFIVVEDEDRGLKNEYSFFQVYMKTNVPEDRHYRPWVQRKPKKSCMIVRYGAYGDMVMMLSLLPPLIAEGYTITVNTGPRGADIIAHDDRIANIIINDIEGPITGGFLEPYIAGMKERYDRVINLTATIEDNILLTPLHPHLYFMPHKTRHTLCNHNYRKWTHDVADVPMGAPPKVILSAHEVAAAAERIAAHTSDKVILVIGRGSAHHKQYKYLAPCITRLVSTYGYTVYIAGDSELQTYVQAVTDACIMYGADKGKIHSAIGWSIRDTIAFAHMVDIVFGPETGVLNAVAYEDVVKFVLLSHSSKKNLVEDWKNTLSVEPQNVPCYPCHRLHYGTSACNLDNEGAAICTKFEPIPLADAVHEGYNTIQEAKKKVVPEVQPVSRVQPTGPTMAEVASGN